MRSTIGLALVLHGLAHSVLPYRGLGACEITLLARGFVNASWVVALNAFVAAGLGLLGARPFHRIWRALALPASALSLAVLLVRWQPSFIYPVALDLLAIGATVLLPERTEIDRGRGGVFRRVLGMVADALAVGFVAYMAVAAVTKPWHRNWGTTLIDRATPLPGDRLDRDAFVEVNHAVTIDAPPEAVWPWLVQIGQDRGGFYSYDWLENLFGLQIRNADRVHPEWQERKVGDLVRATPRGWLGGLLGDDLGWRVTLAEPNRALVLQNWGAFVLVPQPDGKTRLFVRSKFGDRNAPAWGAALSMVLMDLPHFIMERKMLLTIRARAERK